MTINLSENTPRISYTVAAGATQQTFTIPFEFYVDANIKVYVDGTLKTLTTDYTITGGDGTTGSVVFKTAGSGETQQVLGASGGSTVTIVRSIALSRTTDFPVSGAFQITSLNTELDRFVAISSEISDKTNRSLHLSDYDTGTLELPSSSSRANKMLAFDASGNVTTGQPVVPYSAAEVRALVESATDSNVFTDADHTKLNSTNIFTDSDHSKLDAIEANATADQTDAEIRAAVEAASDSNVFTDADHSKLNAIEASATADQTAAEIKTLVESASDSNVFTDADHSKLNAIEASADVTDTANVVAALSAGTGVGISNAGEISVTSVALVTVQTANSQSAHLALTAQEGDVVVRSDENKSYMHNGGTAGSMSDYTLLATPTDAVLSVNGNTGAISAAQIATAVEAASNSNTFTDADHTKLNAIEASADVTDTVNVTAAGALMDSELTNLAAVKAINQSLVTTATPSFNSLTIDNLQLDGSTFSSTNTNGDINIFPNGSGTVNMNADLMVYGNDTNSTAAYVQISASATGGDDIRLQGSNPTVSSYDTSNVSAQTPSMLGAFSLYGKDTSDNYIAYVTLRGYAEDPFAGTNGKEGSLRIQINDDSSIREHKFTATGLDVYNNITLSGTVDGVDIAARDAVLTSTTTTAGAALPKAGGTMTGDLQTTGLYVGSTNTSFDFYNNGTSYLNGATTVDDTLTVNNTVAITSNTPILTFTESDQSNKQYQIGSFGAAFAIYDGSASSFRYVLDTNGNHAFNDGNATFAGTVSVPNGSITTTGGNNLTISGTVADHAGLIFATHSILPAEAGAEASANTIDLGQNGNEFKTLWLDTSIIASNALSINTGTDLTFATGSSERMRIQDDGIVVITSAATPIEPTIKHSGSTGYLAKLRITNRSGQAADKGGLLELGGVSDDGVSRSDIFGSIAGLKSTSGGSNREGYLQFSVSDGNALQERMKIEANQINLKTGLHGGLTLSTYGMYGFETSAESSNTSYVSLEIGGRGMLTAHRTASGFLMTENVYIHSDGNWKTKTTNKSSALQQNDGDIIFYTAPSATADTNASFSETLKLDSDLNVHMKAIKPTIQSNRNLKISAGTGSDVGISAFTSNGSHSFQIYGDASGNYGFLTADWGAWDLRKYKSGKLYLNNNTSYWLDTTSLSRLYQLTLSGAATRIANMDTSHANGGYVAWQESETDKFYIGKSNAISGQANYYTLYTVGGYGLDFHVNAQSTPALRIDTSGNVGIGATSVDELLHLEKSAGTTIVKTEVAANSTIGFEIKKTNATTSNWRIVDGQTVNGKLEIYDVTNSRNIMTFDQSGRVGIGTASPEHDLHVKTAGQTEDGIIKIGGTDTSLGLEISYDQSSNTTTKIISNPTYTNTSALMHIAVDGDANPNQLVLKGDGKIGVSTADPQELLHVYHASSTANLRVSGEGNNNRKIEIGYHASDGPVIRAGSSGQIGLKLYYDNTSLGALLHTNGDWYTNDGTVHSLSDARVKTDVADLTDGLAIVKQLKPKTFKYNSKSDFYNEKIKDETKYGFIADEVKTVAPQYTTTGKGKIDGVEVDDLKSLSTTKMIPMLVKAIQELEARITALEG